MTCLPVLAEDSGLEVTALKGRPGIYSARYAGPKSTAEECLRKILREMAGQNNRDCRFVAVLALAKQGVLIRIFRGTVKGILTRKKKGRSGFGYDPVFFFPPAGKTFAEMTVKEKNTVSHRAKVLSAFREYYEIKGLS